MLESTLVVFVFQVLFIRSQCKHLPAWRNGGTPLIWVRVPRPPLAHVSGPFNVSAFTHGHTYIQISLNICMCLLPETSEHQSFWALLLRVDKGYVVTLFLSKVPSFMCSQPPTPLLCIPLSHVGPLSGPPCFTAFPVSHTHPFSFS